MIFGSIDLEDVVQVNDKTRLSAVKSFVSKDEAAITLVRIKPESSESFITVSGVSLSSKDWYLDWAYQTDGEKTVELEITTNGSPAVYTKTIEVVTAVDDALFSSDQDLTQYEGEILKWVPVGRASWLNIHRQAQRLILDWLKSIGITKRDGSQLTKADFIDNYDVRVLSQHWTLELIFSSISNKPDDIFQLKAEQYRAMRRASQNRRGVTADFTGDGVQDKRETQDMRSFKLVRS